MLHSVWHIYVIPITWDTCPGIAPLFHCTSSVWLTAENALICYNYSNAGYFKQGMVWKLADAPAKEENVTY